MPEFVSGDTERVTQELRNDAENTLGYDEVSEKDMSPEQKLNLLCSILQEMYRTMIANVHRLIEKQNEPIKEPSKLEAPPRKKSLMNRLASTTATELTEGIFTLPENERRDALTLLYQLQSKTGVSGSDLLSELSGGKAYVLVKTLKNDTSKNRIMVRHLIENLQNTVPALQMPASTEEIQGAVESDGTAWLNDYPADQLGTYFYMHVSLADRKRLFEKLGTKLNGTFSADTLNTRLKNVFQTGETPSANMLTTLFRALQNHVDTES